MYVLKILLKPQIRDAKLLLIVNAKAYIKPYVS